MKWFKDSVQVLRDASESGPIQCPRGWGEVAFMLEVDGILPFWDLSRKCPIGGVSSCEECHHPHSPEATDRLRAGLDQLQTLLREGVVTEPEYAVRRRMLIGLHESLRSPPGHGLRMTAWILGPAGIILTGAGVWLMQAFHGGFVGITVVGILLLGLCVSFAVLAGAPGKDDAGKSPKSKYGGSR